MKRLLFIISMLLSPAVTYAIIPVQLCNVSEVCDNGDTIARYKLYQTQNTWTFIKLDTQSGMMWQVQWSLEDDKRFQTDLSLRPLLRIGDKRINGRFSLYPTENIYNFLLLDKISGRTYQVQWSNDYRYRGVIPIE